MPIFLRRWWRTRHRAPLPAAGEDPQPPPIPDPALLRRVAAPFALLPGQTVTPPVFSDTEIPYADPFGIVPLPEMPVDDRSHLR